MHKNQIPKILAYYLPAFHEIPENNEWYGKGFTEWDNTKKGCPKFKHHYQPRIPENNNYYDLTNLDTLRWQSKIARENKIDGFCFYHYWFNGRLILEKPSYLLLQNKDIDIDFCFAWANEPWRKTWHEGVGDSEMLIDQEYSDPQDWVNHYNYFREFFLDDRYIKVNNKPLLLIYRLSSIPDFKNKLEIFDEMAKKDGFSGIQIVNMLTSDMDLQNESIYQNVDFEPIRTMHTHEAYAFSCWRIKRMLYNKLVYHNNLSKRIFDTINYKKFYKAIVKHQFKRRENYYHSCFVDWDNTPRKGNRGVIMKGASPRIFEHSFKKIYESCTNSNDEAKLIFIFAWNEWGEGGYLEPDEKFGDGYLQAIRRTVENFNEKRINGDEEDTI